MHEQVARLLVAGQGQLAVRLVTHLSRPGQGEVPDVVGERDGQVSSLRWASWTAIALQRKASACFERRWLTNASRAGELGAHRAGACESSRTRPRAWATMRRAVVS